MIYMREDSGKTCGEVVMRMQESCNIFVMKAKAGLPAASTTVQCVVAKMSPGAIVAGAECSEVKMIYR